jgi:asparagine synthetase B (glutamine-hydrolysing)
MYTIRVYRNKPKKLFLPVKKKSAFLLSGGLDSPTIASLASSAISEKIKTFSIGFSESKFKGVIFYNI